jgi:hypothetical protein
VVGGRRPDGKGLCLAFALDGQRLD